MGYRQLKRIGSRYKVVYFRKSNYGTFIGTLVCRDLPGVEFGLYSLGQSQVEATTRKKTFLRRLAAATAHLYAQSDVLGYTR